MSSATVLSPNSEALPPSPALSDFSYQSFHWVGGTLLLLPPLCCLSLWHYLSLESLVSKLKTKWQGRGRVQDRCFYVMTRTLFKGPTCSLLGLPNVITELNRLHLKITSRTLPNKTYRQVDHANQAIKEEECSRQSEEHRGTRAGKYAAIATEIVAVQEWRIPESSYCWTRKTYEENYWSGNKAQRDMK